MVIFENSFLFLNFWTQMHVDFWGSREQTQIEARPGMNSITAMWPFL